MFAQYVVNGLLIGSVYACLAVGFSLVWGVLNIINMLHGAFVVIGAYIVIFGTPFFGVSPLIVIVLGLRSVVRTRLFDSAADHQQSRRGADLHHFHADLRTRSVAAKPDVADGKCDTTLADTRIMAASKSPA